MKIPTLKFSRIIILIVLTLSMISMADAGKIVYQIPMSKVSNSMYPAIDVNVDKVYAVVYDKSMELSKGDIICFNPQWQHIGYRWVCHRIVAIYQDEYLTKGDNNAEYDYYVKQKDIQFKVVAIE